MHLLMQSKQMIVLLSHKKCIHLTSPTLIYDLTYQPSSKLISNLSGFVMIISHLRLCNNLTYHNLKHINLKSQCLKYYNITSHKWYIPPSCRRCLRSWQGLLYIHFKFKHEIGLNVQQQWQMY